MSLIVKNMGEIIQTFLQETDRMICGNIDFITCNDLFDIYWDLFVKLKDYRGTSSGFTGFSELLLFRFIANQLGGNLKVVNLTKDTNIFRSTLLPSLEIAQGVTISFPNIKNVFSPDFIVYENKKITRTAEIKVYLNNGKNTIVEAFEKLQLMKENVNDIKYSLLIIYHNPGIKLITFLDELHSNHDWFNYLALQGNYALLKNSLKDKLNLASYIPT